MSLPVADRRRFQPVLGLLICFVLAQALGLAHRVEHGWAQAAHDAGTPHHGQQLAEAQHLGADRWSGHAAGSAECRLLDQVGSADAPCTVPAALPAPRPAAAPQPRPPRAIGAAPTPAAYEARAPPA